MVLCENAHVLFHFPRSCWSVGYFSNQWPHNHWGETGLANAGVSLSKMDAPKVGKSVFCSLRYFITIFGLAIHPPYLYECKGFLGSIGVC